MIEEEEELCTAPVAEINKEKKILDGRSETKESRKSEWGREMCFMLPKSTINPESNLVIYTNTSLSLLIPL